jgi:GH24 family phage-related lysozyme (muramidase)
MRITVRGAGYAIVAALILGVNIILAIETAKATVVVRNVESVQTLMTVVVHLMVERAAERPDRVVVARHREIGDCGPQPEQISEQGKAFIRQHEGLRLVQYYDRIGYAIGYGMHTWQGMPVTRTYPDSPTEADVEDEFDIQLATYAHIVTRSTCAPLTSPMFDALVSVAWNTGHVNTSIVQKVDQGRAVDASDFLVTATTQSQRNRALVDRRLREYIMFTGNYDLAMDRQMPAEQLLQHTSYGN